MSDTPETNEAELPEYYSNDEAPKVVYADFARKMERERDEARQEAEFFRDNALSVLRGGGGTFPVGDPFSWESAKCPATP